MPAVLECPSYTWSEWFSEDPGQILSLCSLDSFSGFLKGPEAEDQARCQEGTGTGPEALLEPRQRSFSRPKQLDSLQLGLFHVFIIEINVPLWLLSVRFADYLEPPQEKGRQEPTLQAGLPP